MSLYHPEGQKTQETYFEKTNSEKKVDKPKIETVDMAIESMSDKFKKEKNDTGVYDCFYNEKSLIYYFEIPGADKSKIDFRIEDSKLIVRAKRSIPKDLENNSIKKTIKNHTYRFHIALPDNIEKDRPNLEYINGILIATFTKKSPSHNSFKID